MQTKVYAIAAEGMKGLVYPFPLAPGAIVDGAKLCVGQRGIITNVIRMSKQLRVCRGL